MADKAKTETAQAEREARKAKHAELKKSLAAVSEYDVTITDKVRPGEAAVLLTTSRGTQFAFQRSRKTRTGEMTKAVLAHRIKLTGQEAQDIARDHYEVKPVKKEK